MNVLYSPTVGILVSRAADASIPDVHFLAEHEQWSDVERIYLLSHVRDWQLIESDGDDLASVIQRCTEHYWINRSESLIICLLAGVDESLAIEVLEHVDGILQLRCPVDRVVNRLLIAPLEDRGSARSLAGAALAAGYATAAGMLDRLVDLQPLLCRLASTWLDIPPDAFVEMPGSREKVWQELVVRGILTRLLEAANKDAFSGIWAALAWDDMPIAARRAILDLGNRLADALYPGALGRPARELRVESEEGRDTNADDVRRSDISGHKAYQRVLKQVDAIARLLAEGRDAKASKFLRELIQEQRRSSSSEHLSKSLCNIAQRCAEMFRPDYERLCLDEAMAVAPNDAWTLVQMGNHLKRMGQHQGAMEMLERAAQSAQSNVALSSIADVWCEMARYDKAKEVYEAIPGWQQVLEVRTGLADLLRHQGEFDRALSEYDRILAEWPNSDRARAGKAEIFKRRGSLDEAIALYDSLIYDPAAEDSDKAVYRLAKCAVLKRASRYEDAFHLADQLVTEAPFYMMARIHRASALALLGKARQGIEDLPRMHAPRAFEGWVEEYCRGLMLLKLRRYKKAKEILVDRLTSAVLDSDEKVVVRLGAAYAHLCREDVAPAAALLSEIHNVRDYYTEYVYHVLDLHLSVLKDDRERIEELVRRLDNAQGHDPILAKAVIALRRNDLPAANRYELELLLRIAA